MRESLVQKREELACVWVCLVQKPSALWVTHPDPRIFLWLLGCCSSGTLGVLARGARHRGAPATLPGPRGELTPLLLLPLGLQVVLIHGQPRLLAAPMGQKPREGTMHRYVTRQIAALRPLSHTVSASQTIAYRLMRPHASTSQCHTTVRSRPSTQHHPIPIPLPTFAPPPFPTADRMQCPRRRHR